MLDSPVSPPWDLSVEMGGYVAKLTHVSANCRLSPHEELTLLGLAICDPADRRFDARKHTPYSAMLCGNRRASLRAMQAAGLLESWSVAALTGGAQPECAVAVPPRPQESRRIYQWQPHVASVSEAEVQALLQTLQMKYSHQRHVHLDSTLQYSEA